MLEGSINNSPEQGKEKPSIKEGVDFVFEQNPELASIGTKEEYSEYLESIFPESLIKKPLFHGTKSEWFKKESFNKDKIGGPDGTAGGIGFLGKGFYFSSDMGMGSYGPYEFLSLLNVKNPKYNMEEDYIGREILKGATKEESIELVSNLLNKSIDYFKSSLVDLNNGIIKRFNVFLSSEVNVENYWENERLKRIKKYSIDLEKYDKALNNVRRVVDDYYLHDGFITRNSLNDPGEMTVRNPEQIHILGSQKDIDGFKKFIESKK